MISLRPYQLRSIHRIQEEWKEHRSTLFVAATGTGKTTTFVELIRLIQPLRTLVVAHREELIFQIVQRVEEQINLDCQIEMADFSASQVSFFSTPVVAATVQTLCSRDRMKRFNPADFGLLILDEAHHATADSYRKIIEHFSQNPELKIVGCTATPDRADEEALGQIFETVADEYSILDAIHDGWLVPVDQQMVSIQSLDFSHVRTTAGDLNGADLARIMEAEKNLQGVCGAAIDIIADKRTVFFTASVRQAEMACEILNRHRPGMAGWLSAKTDKESRRKTMTAFRKGDLQVLCNVGIVSEGVDIPQAEIVIMARPTKSRSLYAQMCGRVLRPLPGIVDDLVTADLRKDRIANSAKPSALVVDFVGNSGQHKLVNAVDILSGKVSERAVAKAVELLKESGSRERISEVLDEAEEELEKEAEARRQEEIARRAKLIAKVGYTKKRIDPFAVLELTPARERGWDKGKLLSEKQRLLLLRQGVDPDAIPYHQAKQMIDTLFYRWHNNLASLGQCKVLKRFGYDTKEMKRADASVLLNKLAANGWRRVQIAA